MIIYILKHSSPKFSGTFFGVGFDKGRGSTSSDIDRDRCVAHGCKDITKQIQTLRAAQKKRSEAKAAKAKAKDLKIKEAEEQKEIERLEMIEKEKKVEEPEKEEK